MSNQNNDTGYFFDTALIPPQFSICGIKLHPFSLGHYLILRHLNNPFVSELSHNFIKEVGDTDGVYWFFNALVVCALTYEENIKLLENDDEMKKTYDDVTNHILKVINEDKDWNICSKILLFKQYIGFHFSMPMYEEETKNEGKPSGIDWTQGIYTALKQDLGYTESEILNMPFRKLFYEWCSIAERNGCIKVFNKSSLAQYAVSKGLIKSGFDYNKVEQVPEGMTAKEFMKAKLTTVTKGTI